MILSRDVNIKITNNLLKYYRELGYNSNSNDIFNILVYHLPKNSTHKVKVKCDFCGEEKEINYRTYIQNTKNGKFKYACSRKCAEEKNKYTISTKYGVDNISQLNEIKIKKKDTCIKNYGVQYPQQSNLILNKSIETKKERYKNPTYNNPKKRKNTNIIRYGVPYPSMNEKIKKKTKTSQFNYFRKEILKKFESDIDLKLVDYDINNKYVFECKNKDHTFNIDYKLLWHRTKSKTEICTICNPIQKNISGLEISLLNFIKEHYNGIIIENNRYIINPQELDIYLPDLKLAFELNGLYWHNELNKSKNYHNEKTNTCEEKGIQLIHIYEDDWIYKQNIVKSMILNKLNETPNKIYARKTEIKEITDNNLVRLFLNENHIQGFVGSSIKLGLFYNNEMVSLMTFGKLRKPLNYKSSEKDYEMLRFCSKLNTNVIGGASKLFKYFLNNYEFNSIVSYADRSYSSANLYKNLGFNLNYMSQPDYYYVIDGLRKHRFGFRKDILIKQGFDPNKSEHNIMLERNIFRIYDSGNIKYTLKKEIN